MGHGICERPAAVLTMCFLGFSPVLAMGGQAAGTAQTPATVETGGFDSAGGSYRAGGFDSAWGLGAGPCPTRFDYVVLASFADASSLLGLSTYHFRSEVGFSRVPLTGWLRVDFKAEQAGTNCRARTRSIPRQPG